MKAKRSCSAVVLAFAAGLTLTATGHDDIVGVRPAAAQGQQEDPSDIVAAQIRRQGFICETPVSAKRDPALQKPDEAVWTLTCKNSTYLVHLVPNQGARIEVIN